MLDRCGRGHCEICGQDRELYSPDGQLRICLSCAERALPAGGTLNREAVAIRENCPCTPATMPLQFAP